MPLPRLRARFAVALALLSTAAIVAPAFATPPACSLTVAYQQRTGLCRVKDDTLHFAFGAGTVRLRTVSADLFGWRPAAKLISPGGRTLKPNGQFLVTTMDITNLRHSSASYNSNQIELVIGGKTYRADAHADAHFDAQSLLAKDSHNHGLKAGGHERGDVVFDVPAAAIAEFHKGMGIVVVANYGGNLNAGSLTGDGLIYI